MKTRMIAFLAVVALAIAPAASASLLQIQFTGVNLCYDGETIFNVDEFDGFDVLDIAVFKIDGSNVGTTVPAYLSTYIDGVEDIAVAGGTVESAANAGIFDLAFGPLGADGGLALDWGEPVSITFDGTDLTVLGTGIVGNIFGQALPFGLNIFEPVTVSFSTQVTDISDDGEFLTSFYSSGTGEVSGPIPEPSTLLLLGAGLLGGRIAARRRKKS